MDEEGLIHRNILAARSRGGAFESMALGTESKRIPGSGFETLGADVPVQDAAEAAGRCAALGRPEIEPGTTRNHHPRSPTAQAGSALYGEQTAGAWGVPSPALLMRSRF